MSSVRFAYARFEPRDMWIGLYWDRIDDGLAFYVCIVPCFVVRVDVLRGET